MDLSKILNKKFVLILVGVIFIAELIWAGRTLLKSPVAISGTQVTVLPQSSSEAFLTLKTVKSSFKVGEEIPVTIEIASDKATDGTDVVLIYDPKMLTAVGTPPVVPGTLYSDYPLNRTDEVAGRILVSGITSNPGGVIPRGVFGRVIFQAKAAGMAKIAFDFTPGSTTDSNVIETKAAKDILGAVNNLEVNIQ